MTVVPVANHLPGGVHAMVEPPFDRAAYLTHHGDSRRNFRSPQCLVSVERQGEAHRIADHVVGKDSRRSTEGTVLLPPLRTGLPGVEPPPPHFLPKRFVH